MEFYIFLIIEIILVFFAIFICVGEQKSKTNLYFSQFIFVVALWVAANFLENEFANITVASFFLKLDFAVAPIIFYFYIMFCFNFPKVIEINIRRKIVYLLPLLFLSFFSFTNLVIKNVEIRDLAIQFHTSYFFSIYAVTLFYYAVIGMLSLLAKLKKSQGVQKTQIQYVLIGVSISAFTALFVNLVLTQLFTLPVVVARFGIYSILIFIIFAAYAVVKHKLLDIRIAISRSTIFIFIYALALGVPFYIGYKTDLWVLATVCAVIFGSAGPFVYSYLRNKAEDIILARQRHYQRILLQLVRDMVMVHDLDKLLNLVVHAVKKMAQNDYAAVFMYDFDSKVYRLKAIKGVEVFSKNFFVSENNLFVQSLKTRGILTFKEMESVKKDVLEVQFGISLLIPSFARDGRPAGFLLLGNKVDNAFYAEYEIDAFNIVANEMGLAIENALLYRKINCC